MRGQYSHRFTLRLLCVAITTTLQVGYTQAYVFGQIPPSTFQFKSVVPHSGPGSGGWKVAQVLILLGRLSTTFPSAASCDVEVGVPEVTWKGPVPDVVAQVEAATAADAAARLVLQEPQPTALMCREFRVQMGSYLGDPKFGPIPGAKVTQFLTPGIPQKTFP